jgi:hypothetical protein
VSIDRKFSDVLIFENMCERIASENLFRWNINTYPQVLATIEKPGVNPPG